MDINLIEIINKKLDWKAAIEAGVDILVKNNYCGNELSSKIIESTIKHGPYFIIMPKVALAHAEPGSYNYKIGISLIKFDETISFSNDKRHDVKLLFTLSAIDSDSHIDILTRFSNLFIEQKNLVHEIINCQNTKQIQQKLKEL